MRRLRSILASALALTVALGVAMAARSAGAAQPDYPACIGQARYENPIAGNQYQELVNALYACDVYPLG